MTHPQPRLMTALSDVRVAEGSGTRLPFCLDICDHWSCALQPTESVRFRIDAVVADFIPAPEEHHVAELLDIAGAACRSSALTHCSGIAVPGPGAPGQSPERFPRGGSMPIANAGPEQGSGTEGASAGLAPYGQRRRVFPGHQRELAVLRRWLSSLLPECSERDDLLSIATELGSNALQHTRSGQPGGWFAVEVTWLSDVVQLAVADCGGQAEPRVIDDPEAERGRGLLLVQGLSVSTGWTRDRFGRVVWAQVAIPGRGSAIPGTSAEMSGPVTGGEAATVRWFSGVPGLFRRSRLTRPAVTRTARRVASGLESTR
jgi:serine/threonine-protein kinase RsbW